MNATDRLTEANREIGGLRYERDSARRELAAARAQIAMLRRAMLNVITALESDDEDADLVAIVEELNAARYARVTP